MSDRTHITVSKLVHARLKKYCSSHGLVMKDLLERLIGQFLTKENNEKNTFQKNTEKASLKENRGIRKK